MTQLVKRTTQAIFLVAIAIHLGDLRQGIHHFGPFRRKALGGFENASHGRLGPRTRSLTIADIASGLPNHVAVQLRGDKHLLPPFQQADHTVDQHVRFTTRHADAHLCLILMDPECTVLHAVHPERNQPLIEADRVTGILTEKVPDMTEGRVEILNRIQQRSGFVQHAGDIGIDIGIFTNFPGRGLFPHGPITHQRIDKRQNLLIHRGAKFRHFARLIRLDVVGTAQK